MRILAAIPIVAALLLGAGCRTAEIKVCGYESWAKVTVPEKDPTPAVVGAAQTVKAAFPWSALTDMLSKVLPYIGQTERKAMEEKVNYERQRSFSIVRIIRKPKD